jgi:hypothetical protein
VSAQECRIAGFFFSIKKAIYKKEPEHQKYVPYYLPLYVFLLGTFYSLDDFLGCFVVGMF